MKFLKFAALSLLVLAFSGCFETDFDFKTSVKSDGSVQRTVAIDGRGANFFKVPAGEWKTRTWETKGGQALLPSVYYHVRSQARFRPGAPIPPDYEFDTARVSSSWTPEEHKRLEQAGIKPPFDQTVFSRNQIKVHRFQGILTVTTIYEEIFQNANVIPLIMLDLKDEIRQQSEARGQNFQDSELEDLARLRLEEEILPQIRFKSEVEMPGEITSTNGVQTGKHTIEWKFSMRDFQGGYSIYTLRAASREFRPMALLFFVLSGLLAVFIFILVVLGMSRFKPNHYDDRPRGKK